MKSIVAPGATVRTVRFSVGKNQKWESVFKLMADKAPGEGHTVVWFDASTKQPIEPSAIVQKNVSGTN
jgi:hypothetical protein